MSMNNDDKEQLEYIRAWVQQKKQREAHKQIAKRKIKYHFRMAFHWLIEKNFFLRYNESILTQ